MHNVREGGGIEMSFDSYFQKMKIYGLTFKKICVNLFSSIKSKGY